eukprot:m.99622 g.99622  ORF g.99622 m.99622 type:complete len:62 (+) comp16768_c0_seq1:635-820(+)
MCVWPIECHCVVYTRWVYTCACMQHVLSCRYVYVCACVLQQMPPQTPTAATVSIAATGMGC